MIEIQDVTCMLYALPIDTNNKNVKSLGWGWGHSWVLRGQWDEKGTYIILLKINIKKIKTKFSGRY